MSQNQDGWNKSENTSSPDWDFSVNPIIEGTYVQLKTITIAQRNSKLAVIRVNTQQGPVDFGVWLNKVLEGKFEDPALRIGYLVRIQFMGMAKPKSGGNAYKNYELHWKVQDVAVSINQQPMVNYHQQMPPINMNELPSYASGQPYQPPVQNQPAYVPPTPVYNPPPPPPPANVIPNAPQFTPPPPPPVQNFQQPPAQTFHNVPVPPVAQAGIDPRFPNLPPPPVGFQYNEQGQLVQDIPF
jgi:hypothetical protein